MDALKRKLMYVEAVKLLQSTYDLLLKVQEKLPGKPTLISLMEEAVQLLSKKYLLEEARENNG